MAPRISHNARLSSVSLSRIIVIFVIGTAAAIRMRRMVTTMIISKRVTPYCGGRRMFSALAVRNPIVIFLLQNEISIRTGPRERKSPSRYSGKRHGQFSVVVDFTENGLRCSHLRSRGQRICADVVLDLGVTPNEIRTAQSDDNAVCRFSRNHLLQQACSRTQ